MKKTFEKMIAGYEKFREKYASGSDTLLQNLARQGQTPEIMVVSCCDSRVDPGLILGGDPGDLFVVRNVANIIPPYEKDDAHHGTSAALEFGVCFLKVKHLIVIGHSQCGGIQARFSPESLGPNDFIGPWMDLLKLPDTPLDTTLADTPDRYAKIALLQSLRNALGFPWIERGVAEKTLMIHLWFFDILLGEIFAYCPLRRDFFPLTRQALGQA